ncbi:hypothetical protein H5368_11690 [Luteimonas sp. MC1782]|uniref:hypothetical protein n=1 Tax=Luteimonas sp. MC1782 TaxID=2760305 RepID=UPI0015FFD30F|nr:hypothetical protein [Luteimonas sp. MC1782]MBB1473694.1 hypothetical protein [Luteimonas sp. MC1782]
MHRARQHAGTRSRELRHRLAHEAARLIAEGGIRDFHHAKRKAAERLGIHDDASLPRNHEIEDALREYQRLFLGDTHAGQLQVRREAALQALEFFAAFDARLVGPVLEGTAGPHAPVTLHLYCDDADAVPRFLGDAGIPAESHSRRVRLDRARVGEFPAWLFSAGDTVIELTVLPAAALRQAPLSAVDEKPMPRASASQLRRLLAEGEEAHGPLSDAR